MGNNYVNKEQLYQHMVGYKDQVEQWKRGERKTKPPIPSFVASALLAIAENLSTKSCYRNYTFREDMVMDGVENCVKYIDNFDPEVSREAFSYFTRVIYFAFLRRIDLEKKQLYVKSKVTENAYIHHGEEMGIEKEQSDYMQTFVTNYERRLVEKRAKSKENVEKRKSTSTSA